MRTVSTKRRELGTPCQGVLHPVCSRTQAEDGKVMPFAFNVPGLGQSEHR